MNRAHTLLLFASAALAAACGAKDAQTDTTAAAPASAPAPAPASKASFDPATHVAVLHAKDFSFDAPDSITAGWTTFHLVNDGPNLHHAQIVRLDSGKTVADLEAALKSKGPPPRWAVDVGGPNAPAPNGHADATMNLEPGQYVILCFVDLPDKIMHFEKGMVRPLKVVASTAAAAPEPTSDASIVLSDYTFTIQGALKAGKRTIKIVNKGPQVHEIELIRLAPGKTMNDFLAWAQKFEGPPPGEPLGGVAGAHPGMTAYTTMDLTPGTYALLCFVPDAKDHKPHLQHGMAKEIKVE